MELEFSQIEIRVLGCLIEKESTTPESYPLTLNSLARACSQKSNREPVMELSESEVQEALDSLAKNMLVSNRSSSDSRVVKYTHRLKDRLTSEFDFDQAELAVVSVPLLRGPQTLGEIRTRSARIHNFEDMASLTRTLAKLGERDDGPYAKQLPRQPGQKEARYTHLFTGELEEVPTASVSVVAVSTEDEQAQRISQLEDDLASLQEEFRSFVKQFE